MNQLVEKVFKQRTTFLSFFFRRPPSTRRATQPSLPMRADKCWWLGGCDYTILTLIWGWEWELFLLPLVLHYPMGEWTHTDNSCSSTPAHASQSAGRWAWPLALLHANMREIGCKDMLGNGESNASVSTVGHGIASAFRAWLPRSEGQELVGSFLLCGDIAVKVQTGSQMALRKDADLTCVQFILRIHIKLIYHRIID